MTVTLTHDNEVEEDETIELRLADGRARRVRTTRTGGTRGPTAAVTIKSEDAVPGAVVDLGVSPDSAKLDLTWKAPASVGSSAIRGYEVHYTSASAADVANGAAATDASAAWVASATVTTLTHSIGMQTNETTYRVRVRAVNAGGAGAWEFGSGTAPDLIPPDRCVVGAGARCAPPPLSRRARSSRAHLVHVLSHDRKEIR